MKTTTSEDGAGARVSWTPPPDVNVQYFYVYRKRETETEFTKIGEVRSYFSCFQDSAPADGGSYRVTAVDEMASESTPVAAK